MKRTYDVKTMDGKVHGRKLGKRQAEKLSAAVGGYFFIHGSTSNARPGFYGCGAMGW